MDAGHTEALALLREPAPAYWRERFDSVVGAVSDSLADHRIRRAAPLAVVVLIGLVGVVFVTTQRTTGVSRAAPLAVGATSIPMATTTTTAPQLVLHAAGAVVVPGLYRLSGAPRVADLIDAAGGLAPDADIDRINLAAPLADGDRLYVPHRGEDSVPSPIGAEGPSTQSGSGEPSESNPLNINTANAEELDALPGVGPATAKAIVDHRSANGPFRSVDGLLEVRGIGPAKLEAIRPLVRV